MKLRARWESLWARLGAAGDPGSAFDALNTAWNEPQRSYHSRQHLYDCLSQFDQVRSQAQKPEEVEAAIWFHDAIYDPKRSDNEVKSAEWAASVLTQAKISQVISERVNALVMATQHQALPATLDQSLLIDVDLSILGADSDRFAMYEHQVRQEYRHVPWPLFRIGRRKILKQFLARPRIYSSDTFHASHEKQARENLAAASQWLAKFPYAELIRADKNAITSHRLPRSEFTTWDELDEIAIECIEAQPVGDVWWVLKGEDGNGSAYRSEAAGNEMVLRRLQELPEFDNEAVIQAMGSLSGSFKLWSKKRISLT